MEFRQLRSFCKVAELGSFSRAAEVLHLTQPALGLQIKNLEEELGISLLTRHSRGVALTSHGDLLLRHAESILAGVNGAFRALKDFQVKAPTALRIGMAPSLAAMLSVPLQRRAAATMVDLKLSLAEAPTQYLNDWVAKGEVDFAIACEGPKHSDVEREEVLREALYLVQPALANEPAIGAPVQFADLADMPLLVADPLMSRQLIDKLQSAAIIAGVSLRVQSVLPSTALVKEAVEDGEGSTVLPYAVVKRDCEQKRLRIRRIVGPTLTRNAYLLSRSDRPQAPDVRNLIREVIADEFRGAPEHGDLVSAV